MYYYQKFKNQSGSGILDSLIGAVTSNVIKDVGKEVAKKTLTEVGNRASQKVVDKIVPRKGKGLNEKSKNILNKYITIQDYVKT